MLLQTNSYVVPKEKRSEHARLLRRFKQVLHKLGCDHFEVYEQVGTNWTSDQSSGRFVQIMRFKDRKQQIAVQAAERDDPIAQAVIAEFCELINFPYQQQQGLFAIGYYTSILTSGKLLDAPADHAPAPPPEPAPAAIGTIGEQMTMVVDREDLAEAVDQGEPHPVGEVHRNPFAEAPIVAPVNSAEEPAGTNGDGHGDDAEPPQPDEKPASPAHAAINDLDELIRQRFGEVEAGDNGRIIEVPAPEVPQTGDVPFEDKVHAGEVIDDPAGDVELPSPAPDTMDEPLPGSGIGAVLDASLNGDDPDLDIALPAELLDPPDSSGPHTSDEPSHAHHEDRGHA